MTRLRAAAAAASLVFLSSTAVSQARPITLAEALAGVDTSPALGVASAQVDEARGRVEQAALYGHNPTIGGSAGVARAGGQTFFDYQLEVGQAIERGGKRSARVRVATAEREAAAETAAATRSLLRADVRRAFELALVAQERVAVTSANEATAQRFAEAARERLKLGAATQTDVNVAAAALGRAIASKKAAERDVLIARRTLGEAIGTPAADLEPTGVTPVFAKPPVEDVLVAEALVARRDLVSMERMFDARTADVELADAQAVPDPELVLSWTRDAVDGSNALAVGLRMELPVWNRNQGARAAARAQRNRASIEAKALRAGVERDVRIAARRYKAATEAVASFDQQVVGSLAENLTLARESMEAGKLGLLELNNVRRDLVESQFAYLDALAEAVEARAALEKAIGHGLEVKP